MKRNIVLFSAVIIICGSLIAYSTTEEEHATCYGRNPCNACKTCNYCAHCAKNGGTCGVCKTK